MHHRLVSSCHVADGHNHGFGRQSLSSRRGTNQIIGGALAASGNFRRNQPGDPDRIGCRSQGESVAQYFALGVVMNRRPVGQRLIVCWQPHFARSKSSKLCALIASICDAPARTALSITAQKLPSRSLAVSIDHIWSHYRSGKGQAPKSHLHNPKAKGPERDLHSRPPDFNFMLVTPFRLARYLATVRASSR